jgi:hypothetical protein
MRILGLIASAVQKAISDAFNRTAGSLGITDSGQLWNAVRGTWYTDGSNAKTDGNGTDSPLASIPFNMDATIKVKNPAGGMGVSWWGVDSGNFWGATTEYHSYTVNHAQGCGPGASLTAVNQADPCMYYCCGTVTYTPMTFGDGTPGWISVCGSCWQQNGWQTTEYGSYIRVMKMVANTPSQVDADFKVAGGGSYTTINSLKAVISGDVVSLSAYSDAGWVTQMGSTMTPTVSSPNKGVSVGIIKRVSTVNQGSTVNQFDAGM